MPATHPPAHAAGGAGGTAGIAQLEGALRPVERYAVRFVETEAPQLDRDGLAAKVRGRQRVQIALMLVYRTNCMEDTHLTGRHFLLRSSSHLVSLPALLQSEEEEDAVAELAVPPF